MIICEGVQKRSGGWDKSQGGGVALYETAMIICMGVRFGLLPDLIPPKHCHRNSSSFSQDSRLFAEVDVLT